MPEVTQDAWIFAGIQTHSIPTPTITARMGSHLQEGSEHQVGAQAGTVIGQLLPDTCTGPCQQHSGFLEAGSEQGSSAWGVHQTAGLIPPSPTPGT